MAFEKLWRLSNEKKSRLILAVDEDRALENIEDLLKEVGSLVVGVKLGFPAAFNLGFSRIKDVISDRRDEFYFLADFKLADIPYIVNLTLLKLKDIGFDGATVHIFQRGLEEALVGNVPEAIGIAAMSHNSPLLDREFIDSLNYAKKVGIRGLVVGALKEDLIAEGKRRGFTIFSPGIGVQGGKFAQAIKAGADFEIVGRAITRAKDPKEVVENVVKAQREALKI